MNFHFQQAIRAVILFAFSAMIFNLHQTGEITKLINPKYENLSKTVAILFFILFVVQLTRIFSFSTKDHHHCHHTGHHCCHHDHGNSPFNTKKLFSYLILIIPLATGFFIPAKTLDASIAEKKGGMMILSKQTQAAETEDFTEAAIPNQSAGDNLYGDHAPDPNLMEERQEIPEEEYDHLKKELSQKQTIHMTNHIYTIYYDDINSNASKYKGKKIQLTGFVLKEKGFKQNQLVLSRFLITHCIADASIIGFFSELPEAQNIDEDTWIEATGTIDISTYNGEQLPIIKIADWKKIEEPKKPYIYPIDIRVGL